MSRLQRGWLRARRRPVAVVGPVVVLLFTALAPGAPGHHDAGYSPAAWAPASRPNTAPETRPVPPG